MTGPRVPWDFTYNPDSQNLVPNLPTLAGEKLGKELARIAAPEIAKDRERFPNQPPPCNECAFVAGTQPNRSGATLLDAIKCMVEAETFFCHKGVGDDGDPKRPCSGWLACVGSKVAEVARGVSLKGGEA